MTPAFLKAVNIILDHEGGYINSPRDPGGETRFGISKRSYPDLNIANLTKDFAIGIYERDFWNKIRGDYLPYSIALILFDFAVTSGVETAVRKLQQAVGAKVDGVIGNQTIEHLKQFQETFVAEQLTISRILYYTTLKNWNDACGGWTRRSVETLTSAILDKVN